MWQAASKAAPPEDYQRIQPLCLSNFAYKAAIQQLSKQLSAENQTENIQALLIGSGHRKLNPPDVDLLVLTQEPSSKCVDYIKKNIDHFNKLANALQEEYEYFHSQLPAQSITRVIAALCRQKVKIQTAYTKNNRSLITLEFGENIYIDLNLYNGDLQTHIDNSDFSINTLYFDIKKNDHIYMHPNAAKDIDAKRLRTASSEARTLFQRDITILFRAIRIIAAENYKAKQLLSAIKNLPPTLPDAIKDMNPDRLTADKISIFCSGYATKALDFLEEQELFYYIFPENPSKNIKEQEKTLFLFRKIAELSDAFHSGDTDNPNYPHTFAAYLKNFERITSDQKKKLILCLFDYALHHHQFLLNNHLDNEKYSIYRHKTTLSFYDSEIYIENLETIGVKIVSQYSTVYEENLITRAIFDRTPELLTESTLSTENYDSNMDETTVEEENSDSENDTLINEDEKTITSPNSQKYKSESEATELNLNTQPNEDLKTITESPSKNTKKNSKRKQARKNKKTNEEKTEKTPGSLPYDEQLTLDTYITGVEYFSRQEFEKSLPYLKQVVKNDICRETLQEKINSLVSEIKLHNTNHYPKKSLSLAVLFDAVDDKNHAVEYYQQFINEKAAFNIFPDENQDEKEESLSHFSFVYLRLMILFREIGEKTEQKENYMMISDKYRNEIILSPIISKAIKNQEREYTAEQYAQTFCHHNNKNYGTKKENPTNSQKQLQNNLKAASTSFKQGLYYNAQEHYYQLLKFVEKAKLYDSAIYLLQKIMICYIQLEMHKQAILFLGGKNLTLKTIFINTPGNDEIMEKILNKIFISTFFSDEKMPEEKLAFNFHVATICAIILARTYHIHKEKTDKVIGLFSKMSSYWEEYQKEEKKYPKTFSITLEERTTATKKIEAITFALNLPKMTNNPACFYSEKNDNNTEKMNMPHQPLSLS